MTSLPSFPRTFLGATLIALLLAVVPAPARQSDSPAKHLSSFSADLPGSTRWKDTGLDLEPGDEVQITASGQLQYAGANQPATPDGLSRGWKDLIRMLPLNDAGRGALLVRLGTGDTARVFLAGSTCKFRAPIAGRLFLGINQSSDDTGDGSYHVEAKILERASGSSRPAPVAGSIPGVSLALLDRIPRRVSDARGDPGDMANFILIGSEDSVRQAFTQAGWVQVDRTREDAVLHGLIASLSKQAYVEMPMSELYLFGRPQDYGFALAEPFEVVYQRHHNRVWKSRYTVDGLPLWVGAGTHDTGLERDQRNGKLTHKIDSEVDKERDFIAASLISTGLVAAKTYLLPSDPVREAHTATGGSFHSDGRVLVMELRAPASAAGAPPSGEGAVAASAFSSVFCSVLEREHPDRGAWGPCSDYIESPSSRRVPLGPISRDYRVAIVSGFLTACFGNATAFRDGRKYLHETYGLSVDLIPSPNRSSEQNGADIARYLRQASRADRRKFILIGYSKGAPDILEGLARDPAAVRAVAAIVFVAGAVGGSPLADLIPSQAQAWLQKINLGGCQGDLYDSLGSLRREVRHRFLVSHPEPGVPVYTISAAATRSQTSKFLLESWELLSIYHQPEDSELLESDTRYPGGDDLGTLRADHFAVAIPLEHVDLPGIGDLANHNRFPRSALLEAIVRYVSRDLSPQ
ncbi:MAG TPA: LssY C-terminal domain-containing protein [Candidatus Acidoferrales bacterium]|nr:LssY C-terminal domain-containing protein [Candidatus Acidoferrales bacterium]